MRTVTMYGLMVSIAKNQISQNILVFCLYMFIYKIVYNKNNESWLRILNMTEKSVEFCLLKKKGFSIFFSLVNRDSFILMNII